MTWAEFLAIPKKVIDVPADYRPTDWTDYHLEVMAEGHMPGILSAKEGDEWRQYNRVRRQVMRQVACQPANMGEGLFTFRNVSARGVTINDKTYMVWMEYYTGKRVQFRFPDGIAPPEVIPYDQIDVPD